MHSFCDFAMISILGCADSAARSQDGSDRGELAADCLATILGQSSAAQPFIGAGHFQMRKTAQICNFTT